MNSTVFPSFTSPGHVAHLKNKGPHRLYSIKKHGLIYKPIVSKKIICEIDSRKYGTQCPPPLPTSETQLKNYMVRIQSSKSTSSERFILAVIVENTSLFCRRSGIGNSILRSSLPGLSKAGSNVS